MVMDDTSPEKVVHSLYLRSGNKVTAGVPIKVGSLGDIPGFWVNPMRFIPSSWVTEVLMEGAPVEDEPRVELDPEYDKAPVPQPPNKPKAKPKRGRSKSTR